MPLHPTTRTARAGLLVVSLLACATVAAAQLAPTDFARGLDVSAASSEPVAKVTLPEPVYVGVVRSDLADIRVFNRAGEVLPHALRRLSPPAAGEADAVDVPVFPLFGKPGDAGTSTRVSVAVGGAVVKVQEARAPGDTVVAYLLDVSRIERPLASVHLAWDAPRDQTFLARVNVDGSVDLSTWAPMVPASPIARLRSGERELRQAGIDLQGQRARYVRVSWPTELSAVRLTGARVTPQAPAAVVPISWTVRSGVPSDEVRGAAEFDTGGALPVERLDLELVDANDVAQVTFFSRPSRESEWRSVGGGVLYTVSQNGTTVAGPPLSVFHNTDRFWRVEVDRDGGWPAGRLPRARFGWYPHELLFLVRGEGPFTLAYGSAVADAATSPLDVVLTDSEGRPSSARVQAATVGAARDLGGQAALTRPRPWRQIALWAVLGLAVAGLAWMAFRASRDMRRDPTPPTP